MKEENKNTRRFLSSILGLILIAIMVWIFSTILVYFKTGADFEEKLSLTDDFFSFHTPQIEWEENSLPDNLQIDSFAKIKIQEAYLKSWHVLNTSIERESSFLLKEYFSDSLQKDIENQILSNNNFKIQQCDLSHLIKFHLFSYDKKLAVFSDEKVSILKKVFNEEDLLIYSDTEVAAFDVVMTMDEGEWRIRHMVRKQVVENPEAEPIKKIQTISTAHEYFLNGDQRFYPRGINYYPSRNPWFEFWDQYNEKTVENDLSITKSLGLNVVRIFIPYEMFGKHEPKEEMLQLLDHFLGSAKNNDIYTIVTLFDFLPGYSLKYYNNTESHLRKIVKRYRDHKYIFSWDIKNEPDLDYKNHGERDVRDWLKRMIQIIREEDSNHLVSIGWSDPIHGKTLSEEVDYVSFHYYRSIDQLPSEIEKLKAETNNKPIFLEEFGLSTLNSWLFPGGNSEKVQARLYQETMNILEKNDQVGFTCWTLYDFQNVPGYVAGNLPWIKKQQAKFGIIRRDGTKKLAAHIISKHEQSEKIKIAFLEKIKPFYITCLIIAIVFLAVLWILRRLF